MFNWLSLGYVGVFLISFVLNMLPFTSPSNLVVASAIGITVPWLNPVVVGFLVALASSFAKLIHYYLTFFIGKALKIDERRFEKYRRLFERFGPLLIIITAMSPIPDEPLVIPLGLMKYNPVKFFLFFFSGKVLITTLGASVGSSISLSLEEVVGSPVLVVISIVLTVLVTVAMVKVDLGDVFERVMLRLKRV